LVLLQSKLIAADTRRQSQASTKSPRISQFNLF